MRTDLSLNYLLVTPSRRPDSEEMPLVILMHGRGADANDLAELAPMLDSPSGFRFVFPNAPKPFEAYPGMAFGWTWFDGWPPVHGSLLESRTRLLQFIAEILGRFPTPPGKIVLGGFSQGALMALDAGLRLTPPPAGILAMSGGLYETELGDAAKQNRAPVFIGHGLQDDVVPVQYARRARLVLEDAGTSVEYHEYPMAHQIVLEEIEDARDFLERCLAP